MGKLKAVTGISLAITSLALGLAAAVFLLKSPQGAQLLLSLQKPQAVPAARDEVRASQAAPFSTPVTQKRAPDGLDEWTERLGDISSTDTEGLRVLNDQFAQWLRSHKDLGSEIRTWVSGVNEQSGLRITGDEDADKPLRAMFFVASGVLSSSEHPEELVIDLLEADEGGPAPSASDEPSDLPSRHAVLTVFSLGELDHRLQTEGDDFRDSVANSLLPALLRTAETSKDLSIVRESVRTLLLLTPDPAPYLAEIKSARAPNELFAIADLMQGT